MNAFRTQLIGFVLCTLTLALLGGCPTDSVPSDVLDELAGTYWVEYADGQLVVFALPECRGEAGTWSRLSTPEPEWYTGPALYEVGSDGTWMRLTTDTTLTLDDIMLTYDPAPCVATPD